MIYFDGADEMAMRLPDNHILSVREWPDGRYVVTLTDHVPSHLIHHKPLPVSRVPACLQRYL
jgi:hypothetical protein